MNPVQYTLGIIASVATFAIVIEMLRRRRLRERHAGWWIVAGLFAIIISVFPSTLRFASELLGFEVPVNLVFFLSLFILFLVALQHSSELTQLESHNRSLVERLIVLELKVKELDAQTSQPKTNNSD
ncbi:DUF2304 domain-containing protein [Aurantimicrobium minutum]|jgi:hypothetical protein|uniref:DUF2304 domain-containing protein n=1 Tax=Aurantimicrobium minutum TaxID=708131 RepID=UPI0024768BE5|nr:DUF2304 domain-containing protein [Aurantimicrobium minutum]MDH6536608.1 hypothetical protein [Aurantimicrobium minutum]